jgi:hypothetical protein
MLVEINLLPRKEQKKVGLIVGLAVLVVLFLLASIIYYLQIHTTKASIESVNNQITQTQKLEAALQNKQGASSNSVNQLKSAIDWADQNRIETIPVMQHLTALLPDRGFIQTFTYNESGTVSISVQFDTPTEAAGYLNSLNHSSLIEKGSLKSLNVSSDSNSTNTNTANSSTTTTVDSNTTNLPRYTGQFDIQFNKDSVKKAIEASKKAGSDWEGGSAHETPFLQK